MATSTFTITFFLHNLQICKISRVFDPGKPFLSRAMFACYSGAYPNGALFSALHPRLGFWDKHSSLYSKLVSYKENHLVYLAPGACTIKNFKVTINRDPK
jgi:hypothetical protein